LVASKHDLVLVVVDNLQMITEVTGPSGLVAATRALKLMAQEFNVAVVATVLQEAELSTENSPIGAIDRYADLVIEISRYDDTDPRSPNSRIGEADLHVVRNRRGVNGTVIVAFQGHYGRFVDFGSGPPVPAPSIDPTPPDDAEPES
jgi:replicative DNA helicase